MMIPLTSQAHELCRSVLKPGETAIDATAGNGHDTLFLAKMVTSAGRVYAFDIQSFALHKTKEILQEAGIENVELFRENHALMNRFIPEEKTGRVGAIMFNLGYLPHGDKSLITTSESTLNAIRQGLELLRPGGIMTILAYTGHPGGLEEANLVKKFGLSLCEKRFEFKEITADENRTSPPVLYVIWKRESDLP